jgi:ATP-dependent Zn protease
MGVVKMSENFLKIKEDFLRTYGNRLKYLTEKEVNNMIKEERTDIKYDPVKEKQYVLLPIELNDDEFVEFLLIKQIKLQDEQDKKLNTIKCIMVFWLIITLIYIIFAIWSVFA